MKKIETEILVIGSGLSGVSASLSAKNAMKKVLVVSSDGGASSMSSGALDIAGDILAIPGKPGLWSNDLKGNIEQIILRNPFHPYHLLGDSSEKILNFILKSFELVFPSSDDFISGSKTQNQFLFNQLGTFKPTAFFQKYMLSLQDLRGIDRAILIDFDGLKNFDPLLFQKNFEYSCKLLSTKITLSIIKADLNNKLKSSLEIAKYIEQNPEIILQKLDKAIRNLNPQLLIIPPILPGTTRREILQNLENQLKARVRELISIPPSVPGKRLKDYLDARLKIAEIEKINARADGFKSEGKKLLSIHARNANEKIEIFAEHFIIASGGFLAGGIIKHQEFKENIFSIPIFHNDRPLGKIFTEKLTSLKIKDPHPVFSVGVKVDPEQRPLGEDGNVIFENLFSAGSILNGANYIFEQTGAGSALATGFRAGEMVAK